jgi:hypothetical protein
MTPISGTKSSTRLSFEEHLVSDPLVCFVQILFAVAERQPGAEAMELLEGVVAATGIAKIVSQRHERGSTIVTSNLPFEEWTVSSAANI